MRRAFVTIIAATLLGFAMMAHAQSVKDLSSLKFVPLQPSFLRQVASSSTAANQNSAPSPKGSPAGTVPTNQDSSSSDKPSAESSSVAQEISSAVSSDEPPASTNSSRRPPKQHPSSSSTASLRSSSASSGAASFAQSFSSVPASSKAGRSEASSLHTQSASSREAVSSSSASSVFIPPTVSSGWLMLFTRREHFGYDAPVIDPAAIARPSDAFMAPVLVNLVIALLFSVAVGGSGLVFVFLVRIAPARFGQIVRRLPLQGFITLLLLWLLHLLIPGAAAHDIGTRAVPSPFTIPVYAFLFFVVVGSSNYIFNNIVTSEGDVLHEFVASHPLVTRVLGERRRLSTETWVIVALVACYGVVGAYINPQFSLMPAAQSGMALIMVVSVILSCYTKDFLRFLLARTWKLPAWFKANVPGFFAAIACIALSRVLALSPGYIYGAPVGLFIVSSLYNKREGLFESLGILWAAILACCIWLLIPVAAPYGVLLDLCNLLFVLIAEHAFFEMIPLPYLAGGSIFGWRKLVWFFEFAAMTFLLFQTLFNPKGTVVSLEQSPPGLTAILLLGCYAVGVFLLWGYLLSKREKASHG